MSSSLSSYLRFCSFNTSKCFEKIIAFDFTFSSTKLSVVKLSTFSFQYLCLFLNSMVFAFEGKIDFEFDSQLLETVFIHELSYRILFQFAFTHSMLDDWLISESSSESSFISKLVSSVSNTGMNSLRNSQYGSKNEFSLNTSFKRY